MAVKTSVYLDDEDKRRLEQVARTTGISEAELLRRGVRLVIAQSPRPRPRLGLGASTDGRSARDADDLLRDSGFGKR